MKTCRDIESLLPLYAEDALTDAERLAVEQHLKVCAKCQKELAYLEKAGQMVRKTPAVEEPPWLRQKIMAQVRKEAQKESFLQRWFYPLRIRIPVQIMATIVIAVLAVYIYRSGENEMKQVLPGVRPPAAVTQKEEVSPEKHNVPQVAAPAVSRPKGVIQQQAGSDKQMRHETGNDKYAGQSTGMADKPQPATRADATGAGVSAEKKAEQSFASRPRRYSEEQASEKAVAAPPAGAVLREQKDAKAEVSDQEQKARDYMASGMAKKAKKHDAENAAAPAAPRSMAASIIPGADQVTVSVYVKDVHTAETDVKKMLAVYDAKIISRQMLEGRLILQVTLSRKDGMLFVSKVKDIGQVSENVGISELKTDNMLMVLEIIPH